MRNRLCAATCAVALAMSLAACASPGTQALEDQIQSLQQQVDDLKARQAQDVLTLKRIEFVDNQGRKRVAIGTKEMEDGATIAGLVVWDEDDNVRIGLGYDQGKRAALSFYNQEGELRMLQGVFPRGDAATVYIDHKNRLRVGVGTRFDGSAGLVVMDIYDQIAREIVSDAIGDTSQ